MKKIIKAVFCLFLMIATPIFAQENSEEDFTIDDNTIIKDEAGKLMNVDKALEMYDTGEWMLDTINDETGVFSHLLLRKATAEEIKEFEESSGLDDNTIVKDETGKIIALDDALDLYENPEWMLEKINDVSGKFSHLLLRKATAEEIKAFEEEDANFEPNEEALVGVPAPDFAVTDSNGRKISLKESKGKVVVLNFWFATCKPCIDELPALNEVYERYKDNPKVVFAAVTFEKQSRVDDFLKKYDFKYPTVANVEEVCNAFKAEAYPTNLVIDKEGNYAYYASGGFSKVGEKIAESIEKVLGTAVPQD